MNTTDTILNCLKKEKSTIQNRFKVKTLGVFGTIARGNATPESDVDILIELDETIDLFSFARLQLYLSELLEKKVDLVLKTEIKSRLKESILKETIYI